MADIFGRGLRVLYASHGHPRISRGGAEIAAFQLFREFGGMPGGESWFLGCQNTPGSGRSGAAITQPFSDREFIYTTGSFEWFRFANRDPRFPEEFCDLLRLLRPDVVHFHHFINFGVEVFRHVREVLPDARIVLTAHEYLAICHHYGQMVTCRHESLCHAASPAACHQCFPEIPPAEFFLRQLYIRNFFRFIDRFVAPSHFLAGRLIAWGVPERQISVIENLIPPPAATDPDPVRRQRGPLRVGYFGQISRLKGINVLLEAAGVLERQGDATVTFDIHGDYQGQPPELQQDFLARLAGAGQNVRFHGRYEPDQVDRLMRQVDLVVVPSTWWENSPLVIQEAFRNRRPVVYSDIGGMAEKVRDGLDGWAFPVGSPLALAALLRRLSASRQWIGMVSSAMSQPPAVADILAAHTAVYRGLPGGAPAGEPARPGQTGPGGGGNLDRFKDWAIERVRYGPLAVRHALARGSAR